MFHPDTEILRLQDLMPASGRMFIKIINKPEQRIVVETPFPLPWQQMRSLSINFDLWQRLTLAQRDLLLLRGTSWLLGVRWFQPDLYQGAAAIGMVGTLAEFFQGDLVGLVVAGGLTTLALNRVWRSNRSPRRELEADEGAIRAAMRRGYTEVEAARHLLAAIEAVAQIEGRISLSFLELLRCQNLRAKAGLSSVSVPQGLRTEREG
jgi:hypothetical protein